MLLILLLRRPVRVKLGPIAAYGLWLAAPLSVLAAMLPAHALAPAVAPGVTLVASVASGLAPLARAAPGLSCSAA